MRFKTKELVLTVLVGCFIALWRGNTDHDVAVAQGRKAVVITRIFTGQDGLAHAEDIELDPERPWRDGDVEGHRRGIQRAAADGRGESSEHRRH